MGSCPDTDIDPKLLRGPIQTFSGFEIERKMSPLII